VVRMSVYVPRNARVQLAAMRLGEVKPLSRGEIDARNAGYKPHSPETWRAWEYWATRAGCAGSCCKKNNLAAADLAVFDEIGRTLRAAQRAAPAAGRGRYSAVPSRSPRPASSRPGSAAYGGGAPACQRTDGERGFLLADAAFIARAPHAHPVGPGALVFVARGLGAAVAEVPGDGDLGRRRRCRWWRCR
jgi:hypothetical protein